MLYEYKCANGHRTSFDLPQTQRDVPLGWTCVECVKLGLEGVPLKRKYGFSMGPSAILHEHYNHGLGKVIHGKTHMKSELSRASDAATARTGIPHNYQPCDPSELRSV